VGQLDTSHESYVTYLDAAALRDLLLVTNRDLTAPGTYGVLQAFVYTTARGDDDADDGSVPFVQFPLASPRYRYQNRLLSVVVRRRVPAPDETYGDGYGDASGGNGVDEVSTDVTVRARTNVYTLHDGNVPIGRT
jgi:hypothetical protein